MENRARKPLIGFETKPEFFEEVKQIADKLETSVSQIARDALREKIAELKRTRPELQPVEDAVAA